MGGEAWIAGGAGQGWDEQDFGLGKVVLSEQDMSECSGCLRIVGSQGQIATVGVFGAGQVRSGFGDLGGEEDVFGLLGSELQGGEKVG